MDDEIRHDHLPDPNLSTHHGRAVPAVASVVGAGTRHRRVLLAFFFFFSKLNNRLCEDHETGLFRSRLPFQKKKKRGSTHLPRGGFVSFRFSYSRQGYDVYVVPACLPADNLQPQGGMVWYGIYVCTGGQIKDDLLKDKGNDYPTVYLACTTSIRTYVCI